MKFTPSQSEAITHRFGPVLVAAGPGSGKTSVIVAHASFLIKRCSVHPDQILVLTFARAAADEMAARYDAFSADHSGTPMFGTFHSVFFRLLKESMSYHPRIISNVQRSGIIKACLRHLRIEREDPEQLSEDILSLISLYKNCEKSPSCYRSGILSAEQFHSVWNAYHKELKNTSSIDFDDILVLTKKLLVAEPDIRAKWQKQFPYILVDEFQDINQIQYDILRILAFPQNNLFAVGDENQCIYGFRGSRPEIMHQFCTDYPDCRKIFLDVNFRCSDQIINASYQILKNGGDAPVFQMKAGSSYKHSAVNILSYTDNKEEYAAIARQIIHLHQSGTSYSQIAVLFRSSHDIPFLSRVLSEFGIPNEASERHFDTQTHFIVSDIMAYLKAASGHAERSDILRIINKPFRGIPRDAVPENSGPGWIDKIVSYCYDDHIIKRKLFLFKTQLQFMSKFSSYAAIEYCLHVIGYENYLKEQIQERSLNANEYDNILSQLKEAAKKMPIQKTFIRTFTKSTETLSAAANNGQDAVKIQTMHAAKGLEYDVVFIPELNKGIMPSSQAEKKNLEEERRLLYVAMTRARCILNLSYVRSAHNKKIFPSVFIHDLT